VSRTKSSLCHLFLIKRKVATHLFAYSGLRDAIWLPPSATPVRVSHANLPTFIGAASIGRPPFFLAIASFANTTALETLPAATKAHLRQVSLPSLKGGGGGGFTTPAFAKDISPFFCRPDAQPKHAAVPRERKRSDGRAEPAHRVLAVGVEQRGNGPRVGQATGVDHQPVLWGVGEPALDERRQ